MPRSNHRLQKAWVWLSCVTCPAVLVLGIAAGVLWWGGELNSVSALIEEQRKHPTLVGLAYTAPERTLKMRRIVELRPELLVLGSSRTLQFRGEFFQSDQSFYNGGRIAQEIWAFRAALERLPANALPKRLLVGFDQWSFNSAAENYTPEAITSQVIEKEFRESDDGWNRYARIWRDVWADLLDRKIGFSPVKRKEILIGFSARNDGGGFRNDGSLRYGKIIEEAKANTTVPARLQRTIDLIRRNKARFSWGEKVNQHAVDEVERLLAWCHQRDIEVVGVLTPFAPSVNKAMKEPPVRYGYMDELPLRLAPLFARNGSLFFNYSTFAASPDDEYIDGFHGSERTYARLLLDMAGQDPRMESWVNSGEIQTLLQASRDSLELIP